MKPPSPSALEKVSGNLATEVALTAVGAAVGGVLAPLLPILSKTLAASRQQQRVETTLRDIAGVLEQHGDQINQISDGQYKLINEIVLAVMHTTDEGKLQYLRVAAANVLQKPDEHNDEALIVARILRDISASELAFLLRAFEFKGVAICNDEIKDSAILVVPKLSDDSTIVSGLISLGLLRSDESTWDFTIYRTGRLAAKVIALVTK